MSVLNPHQLLHKQVNIKDHRNYMVLHLVEMSNSTLTLSFAGLHEIRGVLPPSPEVWKLPGLLYACSLGLYKKTDLTVLFIIAASCQGNIAFHAKLCRMAKICPMGPSAPWSKGDLKLPFPHGCIFLAVVIELTLFSCSHHLLM